MLNNSSQDDWTLDFSNPRKNWVFHSREMYWVPNRICVSDRVTDSVVQEICCQTIVINDIAKLLKI